MYSVISNVSGAKMLDAALVTSADMVFCVIPNINTIKDYINRVHAAKKIFVNMDMAEGVTKDKFGIEYLYDLGVDGVISTRSTVLYYRCASCCYNNRNNKEYYS